MKFLLITLITATFATSAFALSEQELQTCIESNPKTEEAFKDTGYEELGQQGSEKLYLSIQNMVTKSKSCDEIQALGVRLNKLKNVLNGTDIEKENMSQEETKECLLSNAPFVKLLKDTENLSLKVTGNSSGIDIDEPARNMGEVLLGTCSDRIKIATSIVNAVNNHFTKINSALNEVTNNTSSK